MLRAQLAKASGFCSRLRRGVSTRMALLRQAIILVEAIVCFDTPALGLMLGLMFWPNLLRVESSTWGMFRLLLAAQQQRYT